MNRLTVVTWNVWFEEFEQRLRWGALLDALRDANADVIALQEVTPGFLDMLLGQEWALPYQVPTRLSQGYDTLLLSRIPFRSFERHPLHSQFGRNLAVGRIEIDSREMLLATTHLESLRENSGFRSLQLDQIAGILQPARDAVLMGDFNLCSSWDENRNLDPSFADVWSRLRGGQAGWTVDSNLNTMLQRGDAVKTVRYDRVLVRSAWWNPESIELLGTAPIERDLFPSDHFGLKATLVFGGHRRGRRRSVET